MFPNSSVVIDEKIENNTAGPFIKLLFFIEIYLDATLLIKSVGE